LAGGDSAKRRDLQEITASTVTVDGIDKIASTFDGEPCHGPIPRH